MKPNDKKVSQAASQRNALDASLAKLLAEYGINVEGIDDYTTRYLAVPVADTFSKPRTNLLLRWSQLTQGSTVYVDSDLDYHGHDPMLIAAWQGPSIRDWRELRLPPVPGRPPEALWEVLRLLGSPLTERVRGLIGGATSDAAASTAKPELGRALSLAGELIPFEATAAAYETSFRKELAQAIAVIPGRPTPPSSALLWGPAGSGRDHLLLAAAHLIWKAGRVRQVIRVSAARLVAGCIFPGEMDAALMRLLDDAASQRDTLLLIQDLDTCLTGSSVSFSLLCNALDRGLRCLATIRYEQSMARLRADDGIVRRFVGIHVDEPSNEEMAVALKQLATTSAVEVAPAAIQTAVKLASTQPGGEPAAAIALLGGAMAEAAWHGSPQVGPDDVFAVQRNDWPPFAGQE
jgi:hypothetical protein